MKKINLNHANAYKHNLTKVKKFFKYFEVKLLEYLPYSSDLLPCDFWPFPLQNKGTVAHFVTKKMNNYEFSK